MVCPTSMPCAAPSAPLKGQGRALHGRYHSDARVRTTCWATPLSADGCTRSAGRQPPCSRPLCSRAVKAPFCGASGKVLCAASTRRVWHRPVSIRKGSYWCGSHVQTTFCMPRTRACARAGTWCWKRRKRSISAAGGGCSLPRKQAAGLVSPSPRTGPGTCRFCPPRQRAGMQPLPPAHSGPRPLICTFT